MKVSVFGVIFFAMGVLCKNRTLVCPRCPQVCYTEWFDRDNPSGDGDYETLPELRAACPKKICKKPLSIEAQTLSGVPASTTGQEFKFYDTVHGFICVNCQQPDGNCLDYKKLDFCRCMRTCTEQTWPTAFDSED